MSSLTYQSAGVDLEQYADAMSRLPRLMLRTQGPRVLPLVGGFAGMFHLQGDGKKYNDPVLVSGTDGVGTKLKLAAMCSKYDTVGIDLVAMCVNDCLCLGAEPLFFLDYLAIPKDDPQLVEDLVKGVSEGCLQGGMALIGGETAILPDLYQPGDFDLAGFCVGVVERDRIIDGKQAQQGDVLIGLPSSGVHSNGYSLVRKIVFEHAGLTVEDTAFAPTSTVGDVLLKPTRIYVSVIRKLLESAIGGEVTGLAHITGGGLQENINRIFGEGLRAAIDRNTWTPPPVFPWLQRLGNVDVEEMFRVFNMGIGFVVVVRPEAAEQALAILKEAGEQAVVIGSVEQEQVVAS
jgi:phosphoribosylformylglycinamidine cyclo-ligase